MRNLKKFLALVLAMMMALSLMVTVNAKDVTADFTDADSVTEEFQEGVDVLNGMKVFEGYEDGTFKPKNNITRAEVATIVYRLATGDWEGVQAHLYKDYQKFTDVKSDHWAAGYINYCANAEWIAGYGNGKFGPNDQVTGYQAAAMILRAVGYGKNGEFQGSGWQVQVANVTRSEYLLVNVDNTTYANTLNQAAPRELVAEILFQAAQIPTVTWTMLGGYNKYTTSLTVAGQPRSYNPSLGWTNYGLECVYGIIVDNQETALNRKYTSVSIAVDSDGDYDSTLPYVYDRDSGRHNDWNAEQVTRNRIIRLDLDTGLNDFAHACKVWYNGHNQRWTGWEDTTTHKTYAAYDKSTKVETVYTGAQSNVAQTGDRFYLADRTDATVKKPLGTVAESVGFKLRRGTFSGTANSEAGSERIAHMSKTYSDFFDAGSLFDRPYASPSDVYVLISNNSDGETLDVIVSLDVETTKITAINNNVVDANKSISVAWNQADECFKSTKNTIVTNEYNAATATDPATFKINQNKLTANSSITHQDYVIANALVSNPDNNMIGNISNDAPADIYAYNTKKVMTTKSGTVSGAHVNAGWDNADPDYVVVDGEKLYKSPYYYTVPNANTVPTKIVPQIGNGNPAAEIYEYAEYEFYLDSDGKYIGAKKVSSSDFIYGTYVDYAQELNSSAFNYYMTGVDKDGKVITKQVKTATTKPNMGDTTAVKDTLNSVRIHMVNNNYLPYRDTTNNGVNGIGQGIYGAFTITGDGDAVYATMLQQGATDNAWNDAFDNVVTINKTASTLGAVDVDPGNNATNDIDNNLYFTENTKFVLVEGFGTDSLKSEVYQGITELLGNNREVRIDLTAANGKTPATGTPGAATDHFPDAFTWAAMTYMEKAKFIYEQSVNVPAEQATLVILPKAAVSFVGGGNLYYVGNQTPGLRNGTGTSATQFTMYDAQGNESIKWIAGDYRNAGDDAQIVYSQSDRFYELVETKDKAQDGQPVYALEGHAAVQATYNAAAPNQYYANNGIIDRYPAGTFGANAGLYTALTYSTQNASIMGNGTNAVMYNVANAKVVNLADKGDGNTLGTRYPGISDLTTLNNSSYNLNNGVKVACVLDKDNPLIVTTIFVCYNQDSSVYPTP